MPQRLCTRCNQRVTYSFDSNDVVHECANTTITLTQEDRLITGEIVTEFGEIVNTGVKGPAMMLQGVQNKFQGTLAGIEGERFQGVTRRGANAATHRQRQHFEFINLK